VENGLSLKQLLRYYQSIINIRIKHFSSMLTEIQLHIRIGAFSGVKIENVRNKKIFSWIFWKFSVLIFIFI